MSNSSTVDTTTTPAEVSGGSGPQSLALPSRLKPITERNKTKANLSKLEGIGHQYVREIKNDYNKLENRLFCTATPLYLKQLESLGLSMEVVGEDMILTRIANLAKSVEHRVDVVIRLKAIDYLGVVDKDKRTIQEFFVYHKLISGFDKRGSPLGSAYVTLGQDYQVPVRQEYSEEEEPLAPHVSGPKFEVFTIPWGQSEFDKVMENQDPSRRVQYTITNGNASYGGYSQDEFRNCSFAECEMRGKTGFVNQPTDIEISNIPKNERVNMFKGVLPK